MANQQVKDVLDSTRKVHERAGTYFAHLAKQSDNARVQMLLGYLSAHEQHLAEAVRNYEEEASEKILATWVSSTTSVTRLAEQLDWDEASRSAATFDELVALGLEIDNQVIAVYDDLAQRAEPEWLREIFADLLDMEQQEEKMLAKQTLRAMDL